MRSVLSINEAVERFDGAVSRSTIWRCCRDGLIPAAQIGHRWLISATWVDKICSLAEKKTEAMPWHALAD